MKYTAAAMHVITKCVADCSPFYKVHVNVTSEKHFHKRHTYKIYTILKI